MLTVSPPLDHLSILSVRTHYRQNVHYNKSFSNLYHFILCAKNWSPGDYSQNRPRRRPKRKNKRTFIESTIMALVRIIASIRPAVTNKFFSIEACRSSSAMSSLFIKSGGYRYHQHTSPRISGIAPVTALLFSFGTNYLLSTECTPNEPDEKRHLCNSAATMLFHSRKQSLTIGAAMKAAGYSKQECESEMHQKRVQRERIKLE